MGQYDFTLKFALTQRDADKDELVERLGAEGCDDALVGLGQHGRIALNFIREADSASEAVYSALSDVKRAIPDALLVEAAPDLVGITDIADLCGVSRQYIRKLVINSGAGFPLPVHEGKPVIWHLSKVLSWVVDQRKYEFDQKLLDLAHINMQCNILKDSNDLDPKISDHLKDLVV